MTDSRVGGQHVEVATQGDPDVRVAGLHAEVAAQGDPDVRLAGLHIEVAITVDAPVRVAAEYLEVVSQSDAPIRVAAEYLEVVSQSDAPVRVAAEYLEVISRARTVGPVGGISDGAMGDHIVSADDVGTISPAGIPSAEALGTPDFSNGAVGPTGGIASGFAAGSPIVVGTGGSDSGAGPMRSTNVLYTPVTFESVGYLSGTLMPDGRGLLTWGSNNQIHMAVLGSPMEWLADSVVTASEGSITFEAGYTLLASHAFTVDDDVYLSVQRIDMVSTRERFRTEIYRAVDPADPPAGWVLHGTVQSADASEDNWSLLSGTYFGTGVPYVIGGSGGLTWVMGAAIWNGDGFINAYSTRSGLWRSTDGGVTWSLRINSGYYILGGTYIDLSSTHLARNPADGALYWYDAGGPSNNRKVWRSYDNGANWSVAMSDAGPRHQFPFTGADGLMYSLGTDGNVYQTATPGVAASYVDAGINLMGTFHVTQTTIAAIGMDWHLFNINTVQFAKGGWSINSVALG